MKLRLQLCSTILLASTALSQAADSSRWFPGALDLNISPALPTNYVVVSANPAAKDTGEMDILDGVIWAPERTARQFDFGGNGRLNEAKDPLFHVVVTPLVRQLAGTTQFSNEKDLEANSKASGLKKVKTAKTKWGDYPVLSMTFENPLDGATMFVAWVGANTPEEWTVLINYRVPQGKKHPTKEEIRIWETFLRDTKAQKSPSKSDAQEPRKAPSITPGISYGMTQEEVIANLEKTQKVVSREDARMVTEGHDGVWDMKRRNIFIFQNGRLVVHQNDPAGD